MVNRKIKTHITGVNPTGVIDLVISPLPSGDNINQSVPVGTDYNAETTLDLPYKRFNVEAVYDGDDNNLSATSETILDFREKCRIEEYNPFYAWFVKWNMRISQLNLKYNVYDEQNNIIRPSTLFEGICTIRPKNSTVNLPMTTMYIASDDFYLSVAPLLPGETYVLEYAGDDTHTSASYEFTVPVIMDRTHSDIAWQSAYINTDYGTINNYKKYGHVALTTHSNLATRYLYLNWENSAGDDGKANLKALYLGGNDVTGLRSLSVDREVDLQYCFIDARQFIFNADDWLDNINIIDNQLWIWGLRSNIRLYYGVSEMELTFLAEHRTPGSAYYRVDCAGSDVSDELESYLRSNYHILLVNYTPAGLYSTSLTINVPLTLVYSDEFEITGILSDSEDTPLSGYDVDLYVGDTQVDSAVTDSNGEYSFTQTPVHMGDHTFQVKFERDGDYNASQSSTVTRSINKETTVLNVSSPLNGATVTDGSFSVTGSLFTDDAEPISNATIYIYSSQDILGASMTPVLTLTTDSNGAFSGTVDVSNYATGVYTFRITYEGNDYYTGSTEDKSVTVGSHSYSLILSGTSTTVAPSGSTTSCTVTGTLKDNNMGVGGETITVTVKDSTDATIDTDTITTDGNGQASYTYAANNNGEVTIYMGCMNLQETYTIEDVAYYDSMLSANSDWITSGGSVSSSYSSDGCEFKGTTGGTPNECDLDYTPSGDYQLECIISSVYFDSSSYNATAMIIVAGVKAGWTANGSNLNVWDDRSHDIPYSNFSTPMPCKFIVEGTSVKLYLNNVLINTYTKQSDKIGVEAYNYRGITLKDLKITEL